MDRFLAPDETLVDAYHERREEQEVLYAVTDRRLLIDRGHTAGYRPASTLGAYPFEKVGSHEVDIIDEERPDSEMAILGGVAAVAGFVGFFAATNTEGNVFRLLGIAALAAFCISVYLFAKAYDTESGVIHVTVDATSGVSRTITLPRTAEDFAQTVTSIAGDVRG